MDPYRGPLSSQEFDIFYGAPLLIVVCAEDDPIMPVERCFLTAENLMLAAQDRGLGICCIGLALPFLRRPDIKAELDMPEAVTPALPIIVGWPQETPESTPAPFTEDPGVVRVTGKQSFPGQLIPRNLMPARAQLGAADQARMTSADNT